MPSSFSSQGSNVANPQAGLIKPKNGIAALVPQQALQSAQQTPAPAAPAKPNPGLIPSTPVKKITAVDGSTTEFHAPPAPAVTSPVAKENQASTTSPQTSEPAPTSSYTPPASDGTNFRQNLGSTLATGGYTDQEKQAYEGLLGKATTNSPELDAAYKAKQDLQESYAKQASAIQGSPIPLEFQQGRAQILANQYGSQLSAAETAISNALAKSGQQISAGTAAGSIAQNQAGRATGVAESVQGATAPQGYGLTTQPYNPGTDTYGGGGANGAIDRASQAANIGSAQDLQGKINDIKSKAPAADAAFSVLNSYAQGIGANTPIAQGISQLYGSTLQGSQAVAGFKAQLQAVRAAWAAIEGGDPVAGVPENVTPAQLTQIQKQLKTDATNKQAGYQNQLDSLASSSSGSSGSGNIYDF